MERAHIGIFGRCNAGKSTLLNLLTGAPTAMVSPRAGTTTDAVRKTGEITGVGPVVFIDTAGTDDHSPLGGQRMAATREAMRQVDLALLVFREWDGPEQELLETLQKEGIAVVLVRNEWGADDSRDNSDAADSACGHSGTFPREDGQNSPFLISLNALYGDPASLFDAISKALPHDEKPSLFGERVGVGDVVVLVIPIDGAAPAGRLILPQVQTIRELLDSHAITVVVQLTELAAALENVAPRLVVADSQVLAEVRELTPDEIEVTSFSILLAATKGDRALYERGLAAVDMLKEGDRILIAESCTHQSTCDDIGRVKIPHWLGEYTGVRLDFTVVPGLAPLPDDIADHALVVQCGGCMVTRRQIMNRLRRIDAAGVPVVNYGMLIQKIRR